MQVFLYFLFFFIIQKTIDDLFKPKNKKEENLNINSDTKINNENNKNNNSIIEKRQENIKRKSLLLQSLGITKILNDNIPKPKKKKVKVNYDYVVKPDRVLRSQTPKIDNIKTENDIIINNKEELIKNKDNIDIPDDYIYDSSVKQYLCSSEKDVIDDDVDNDNGINGFISSNIEYSNCAANKIYSISKSNKVFCCGGEKGRMSIYCDNNDNPNFSFQAHSGWLSSLNMLNNTNNILLSTGNDGHIMLWDLNKTDKSKSRPQLIFNTSSLHNSGIFTSDIVLYFNISLMIN